jgi:hypothetical protein
MNFSLLLSWVDFLLLGLAAWTYYKGYQRGKTAGYRDAYQIELNDRMETFLDKQNSE